MKEDYYNRARGCERNCILLISIFILLLGCEEIDETRCWDCKITISLQYSDTTIIHDTIQTWCEIDKQWFEKINTYYAEYPEYGFIVNQFVKCK